MSTRPERVYSDKGVVLRTYKLGESDRIVVLLTEANGKVRAVAKGVRKTKSRFGSRLVPLSHVSVLLYRGRELDVVNQVEPLEPAGPLRNNLDKMTQGIAMLEAVEQLTPDREDTHDLGQTWHTGRGDGHAASLFCGCQLLF